jgi:hypothetical protein
MASQTKQTESIRKHKLATRGKARKTKQNKVGTTRSATDLFAKKKAAPKA